MALSTPHGELYQRGFRRHPMRSLTTDDVAAAGEAGVSLRNIVLHRDADGRLLSLLSTPGPVPRALDAAGTCFPCSRRRRPVLVARALSLDARRGCLSTLLRRLLGLCLGGLLTPAAGSRRPGPDAAAAPDARPGTPTRARRREHHVHASLDSLPGKPPVTHDAARCRTARRVPVRAQDACGPRRLARLRRPLVLLLLSTPEITGLSTPAGLTHAAPIGSRCRPVPCLGPELSTPAAAVDCSTPRTMLPRPRGCSTP